VTAVRNPRKREIVFELAGTASQSEVWKALRGRFSVNRTQRNAEQRTYYDTFDWRLHGRGMALFSRSADDQMLLELEGNGARLRVQVEKIPRFADELEQGPLRDALAGVVENRRLHATACLDARSQCVDVEDDEGKTIVRVRFERNTATDPASPPRSERLPLVVRVQALRGYRSAFRAVREALAAVAGLRESTADPLDAALARLDRKPYDYSTKPDLHLGPAQPAGDAVRMTLAALLRIMQSNEDGICRDLDPEHLHDFRVAVRRSRYLLRTARDLLAREVYDSLRSDFSWLGTVTGPARDLDVHLEQLRSDAERLGPEEEDALAPLVSLILVRRAEARRRLLDVLASVRYAEFHARAKRICEPAPGAPLLIETGPPVVELAAARSWRAWRRLVRAGRAIEKDTPAQALHEVRLDAKRLRYLLDFFHSVFPTDDVQRLTKELRRLQNNLGRFNDARVQQSGLRGFAADLAAGGETRPEAVIVIGRLVEDAVAREHAERERFAAHFARFDRTNNRKRVRRLFQPHRS
jgi:CHAD domain-containing protein